MKWDSDGKIDFVYYWANTMDAPIFYAKEKQPPYLWLKAFEYPNRRKLEYRRRQVLDVLLKENQFMQLHMIKVVQVAIFNLDQVFDIGVYVHMPWDMFKAYVFKALKIHSDQLKFDIDKLQDIVLTNNPNLMSPGIDTSVHDLYTIIPDNSLVFISQIKIDCVWSFFK